MSLERLKKYSLKIAFIAKILTYATVTVIACETVCFIWQALVPGKLNGFFNMFRIYAPFISNIDNNALCLFELAGNLFNNLFVFLLIDTIRKMFDKFSSSLQAEELAPYIKKSAIILITESFAVPIMKMICYSVFVQLPLPTGIIDIFPVIAGVLFYFIAIIIESTSVIKG